MSKVRYFFLILFLTSNIAIHVSAQSQNESYFIAKGFQEAGAIDNFFADLTDEQIGSFRFHPNPKISIFASWISCVRNCKKSKSDQSKCRDSKSEFVGFVSGKLNVAIPSWWRDDMLGVPIVNKISGIKISNGIAHQGSIAISELSDAKIKGSLNDVPFDLSWSRKKTNLTKNLGFLAVNSLNDGRKIFAISDRYNNDFLIYCVGADGEELWRSEVLLNLHRSINGRMGIWHGVMEIVVANDTVVLFGANEISTYLDTFSLSTGEPLSRFTTLY